MVRRRAASDDLPPMTMDQAHAVMRELGEHGDPNDPRYEQVRERVIEAIFRRLPPGHVKSRERAAAIFNVLRKRPDLVPCPPPGVASETRLWLPPSVDASA